MLTESIHQDLPSSQSPELKLNTVQKLPSTGFIKVDLKDAWVEFIKRKQVIMIEKSESETSTK